MAAELHLAKDALALHLLLQHFESLVDIVVTDENLDVAFLFAREVDRPCGHAAQALAGKGIRKIGQVAFVSQGTHSTATLAPLFRRGWLPSWSRRKPWNAQSGWFCQRGKSPSAMVSAAAPGSLRRRKNRRDRSCDRIIITQYCRNGQKM